MNIHLVYVHETGKKDAKQVRSAVFMRATFSALVNCGEIDILNFFLVKNFVYSLVIHETLKNDRGCLVFKVQQI
jgi:hypothetical protein